MSESFALSPQETRWVDQAVAVWRMDSEFTGIRITRPVDVHIFSATCELASPYALNPPRPATWTAKSHTGPIQIGYFHEEVGPISRAGANGDQALFLISAPFVWTKAGVQAESFPLATLMANTLATQIAAGRDRIGIVLTRRNLSRGRWEKRRRVICIGDPACHRLIRLWSSNHRKARP